MALERSSRTVDLHLLERSGAASFIERTDVPFARSVGRAPLDWIEVVLFLSGAFLVVAFCITVLMATDAAIATARVLLGTGAP